MTNTARTALSSLIVAVVVSASGLVQAAAMKYEQEALADNPVALWRLGEGSGNTLVDSSGNGLHGTYFNPNHGAAGVGLQSDLAVGFNGTNSYANVPDHAAFNFQDYTLSAWVKLENPTGTNLRIVSQQDSNFWLLHVSQNPANQWRLTGYSSLDGVSGVVHGPDLNDGQFHHVAISRNTTAGLLSWYVDGNLVGSAATSSTASFNIAANVFIGSISGTGQFFPGVIDEVALFNTALSLERIEAHFAAGTFFEPHVPEPSTALLLSLAGVLLVGTRRGAGRNCRTR